MTFGGAFSCLCLRGIMMRSKNFCRQLIKIWQKRKNRHTLSDTFHSSDFFSVYDCRELQNRSKIGHLRISPSIYCNETCSECLIRPTRMVLVATNSLNIVRYENGYKRIGSKYCTHVDIEIDTIWICESQIERFDWKCNWIDSYN